MKFAALSMLSSHLVWSPGSDLSVGLNPFVAVRRTMIGHYPRPDEGDHPERQPKCVDITLRCLYSTSSPYVLPCGAIHLQLPRNPDMVVSKNQGP